MKAETPLPSDEEDEEESEDDGETPFVMKAYCGGIAKVAQGPHVFALSGMNAPVKEFPALLQHDPNRMVGYYTSSENNGQTLTLKGKALHCFRDGKTVAASLRKGFPWQASVGLEVDDDDMEAIEANGIYNGRMLTGPFCHVKASCLREASFTPFGADGETEARKATATTEDEMTTEAKPDPVLAERQRVKDIRAAFPTDPTFALDHIDKGSTVLEAKAAYADVLATKVQELMTAAATPPPANFAASETTRPTTSTTTPEEWRGEWEQRYTALMASGEGDYESRRKATIFMLTQRPGQTKQFVAAANRTEG